MQPVHGSSEAIDGISTSYSIALCAHRAGIKPEKWLCSKVRFFAYIVLSSAYWIFTPLLPDRVKLSCLPDPKSK